MIFCSLRSSLPSCCRQMSAGAQIRASDRENGRVHDLTLHWDGHGLSLDGRHGLEAVGAAEGVEEACNEQEEGRDAKDDNEESRDDGFARIVCRLARIPHGLATTHGVGVARVGLVADAVLVNEAVEVRAGVARSVDVAGGVTVLAVAALVDLVEQHDKLDDDDDAHDELHDAGDEEEHAGRGELAATLFGALRGAAQEDA
mmetsp:Transcript_15238/g.36077  ORF Transcript_15238/g.36077 Transcript_15238/m.36077 type:complete len:201 (-) Transcript_15238:103-705(-)